MKSIFLVIIMLYSFFSFASSIDVTGKAPYFKTKPNFSKKLAIEDALFNAGLMIGGDIDSSWSLTNVGHLKGGVRMRNYLRFKEIQVKKCWKENDQFLCSLRIEHIININSVNSDFKTNKGACHSLSRHEKNQVTECFEVNELTVTEMDQVFKITGVQEIFIYRDGINGDLLRYSKKEDLIGLGKTLELARRSLTVQGEGMFRKWLLSEERNRLIFEEILLDSFIFAIGSCNYECMISKGIYPIEIHSYGRKVLILGKRLR